MTVKNWMITEWLKFVSTIDEDGFTLASWKLHGFSVCSAIWETLVATGWITVKTVFISLMAAMVFVFPIEAAIQLSIMGKLSPYDLTEVGQMSITIWSFVGGVTVVFYFFKGVMKLFPDITTPEIKCSIKPVKINSNLFPNEQ